MPVTGKWQFNRFAGNMANWFNAYAIFLATVQTFYSLARFHEPLNHRPFSWNLWFLSFYVCSYTSQRILNVFASSNQFYCFHIFEHWKENIFVLLYPAFIFSMFPIMPNKFQPHENPGNKQFPLIYQTLYRVQFGARGLNGKSHKNSLSEKVLSFHRKHLKCIFCLSSSLPLTLLIINVSRKDE